MPFFFSLAAFLSISHVKLFFPFKPRTEDLHKQLSFNSIVRIIQQQCILLEDGFSFLKTFWLILLS